MVDLNALAELTGRVVELEFADGHAVRAKLVTVDREQPQEIIYDILAVLTPGPLPQVKAGTIAAAEPSQLRAYRVVT